MPACTLVYTAFLLLYKSVCVCMSEYVCMHAARARVHACWVVPCDLYCLKKPYPAGYTYVHPLNYGLS